MKNWIRIAIGCAAMAMVQAAERPQLEITTMHAKNVIDTAITDDGQLVFSCIDNEIKVWDRHAKKVLKSFSANSSIRGIQWLESEQALLVDEYQSLRLLKRETLDWANAKNVIIQNRHRAVSFDEEWGQLFYADTRLRRYELPYLGSEIVSEGSGGFKLPESDEVLDEASIVSMLPFGYEQLIVGALQPRGIYVLDTDFAETKRFAPTRPGLSALVWLSDGKFMAFFKDSGAGKDLTTYAVVYDAETLTQLAELALDLHKNDRFYVESPSNAERDNAAWLRIDRSDLCKIVYEDGVLTQRRVGEAQGEGSPFHKGLAHHFVEIPGEPDRFVMGGSRGGKGALAEFSATAEGLGFESYASRVLPAFELAVNPQANEFLVWAAGVASKRVRVVGGRLRVDDAPFDLSFARYSDDGTRLAYSEIRASKEAGQVYMRAVATVGRDGFDVIGRGAANGSLDLFTLSPDGASLLQTSSGRIYVTKPQAAYSNFEYIRTIGPFSKSVFVVGTQPAVSPDGKLIALNTYDSSVDRLVVGREQLLLVDETGQPARSIDVASEVAAIRFIDAKTVSYVGNQKHGWDKPHYVEYDLEADAVTKSFRVGDHNFTNYSDRTAYSEDGALLAVSQGRSCSVYRLSDGKRLFSLPAATGSTTGLAFFADDRFLLTISGDSQVHIWDAATGAKAADLTLFVDGGGWVLNTDNFFFDASADAAEEVYFAQGEEILPLDALYQQFHTPNLFGLILQGAAPTGGMTAEQLRSAPTVEIVIQDAAGQTLTESTTLTEVTVHARAIAKERAVGEVRLYHNDKRVSTATRGLAVEDDEPEGDVTERAFSVALLPGENRFRAVASNVDQIESRPAVASIVNSVPKPTGGFKLHLLAVGINAYKNPKYNLNFARTDAEAFASAVAGRARSLFGSIETTVLVDGQASRAAIVEALEAVAETASPRDVFVFYYAGHGVMSQEAEPQFYLVPPDIVQLYGNDRQLQEMGVSATLLRELSAKIPAQKQLFVIDACQSAGALQTVAMRGAAEEQAIARLARSTGTHWLTASGSEQFAAEFESLKHGAFTYALLEALKGGADQGDRQVSVRELDAFLQLRVPELTLEYRGTPQYPASFGYGQDFPIAVVE